MFNRFYVCFILASLSYAASCTPFTSWLKSSAKDTQSATSSKEQPKPDVTNAFAYARFVALNLDASQKRDLAPEAVESILLENSERSKVTAHEMLMILRAKANLKQSSEKSTSQLRFEAFAEQVDSCSARGFSKEECCRAMAWPVAVLPELAEMEAEPFQVFVEQAKTMKEKRLALMHWKSPNYRLAGLKAWLGACHTVLNQAPQRIEIFRKEIAPDLGNPGRWSSMLHPKSRAKRGPRRVYSRNDGQISIAETLRADCSVQETEVLRRRPDGSLDYWVYDTNGQLTPVSHFPAPSGNKGFKTVEKLSPDSCMGCHYDFETRHFDQLKVSADLLGLPKTSELPVLCAQPGEIIANDN